MVMDAAKPNTMITWEQSRPKLCWDCDHFYRAQSRCQLHNAIPPLEFQETPNACTDWQTYDPYRIRDREVPF